MSVSQIVNDFMKAKKALLWHFNCRDDYYVKTLPDARWRTKEEDEMFFLSYLDDKKNTNHAVIVKKDGKPLIYIAAEFTLVVAIDCVKIAFIFNNKNKMDD